MKFAWDKYREFAWGHNELKPNSKKGMVCTFIFQDHSILYTLISAYGSKEEKSHSCYQCLGGTATLLLNFELVYDMPCSEMMGNFRAKCKSSEYSFWE